MFCFPITLLFHPPPISPKHANRKLSGPLAPLLCFCDKIEVYPQASPEVIPGFFRDFIGCRERQRAINRQLRGLSFRSTERASVVERGRGPPDSQSCGGLKSLAGQRWKSCEQRSSLR